MTKLLNTTKQDAKRLARKQAGLTLGESLLVLGVAALIAVGAYGAFKFANSDVAANDLGRGAVTMVSQVKRINTSTGYASVTSSTVKDIVPGGWKHDGTDVLDNYGNKVDINGATGSFAMAFNNLTAADCQKVVSQVEGVAYIVQIGAAAGAAAGKAAGGTTYKAADGTLNAVAVSSGCAEASRKIAIEIH
ncbi:MAG: hypothetical protein L6Q73_12860 [Aquabacterium sp.]|jgi:hypothetical protein|nr:hypothetical protein [Aquabacterium sp.]